MRKLPGNLRSSGIKVYHRASDQKNILQRPAERLAEIINISGNDPRFSYRREL